MYEKLTDIFTAVAVKYLSAVDVHRANSNSLGSNQHEIGGLVRAGFADYLGRPENGETRRFLTTMVYIETEHDEPLICEDTVSWYDTRYRVENRGPEYRLYYKDNEVTEAFQESDFFLIAITKDNRLLIIATPSGSSAEYQLRNLFGAAETETRGAFKKVDIEERSVLLPVRTLLAQLGIEIYASRSDDEIKLSNLLSAFNSGFPATKEFSSFARGQIHEEIDPMGDPDTTLLTWMEEEEHLFRILERHIVHERLKTGFAKVDEFIKFSLSVQNRRKSRVGHAFEHHIETILQANHIAYARGSKTEQKQKPDFIFPGDSAYHDSRFDESKLRMLGAKTTCKERWRQVLAEADRIDRKHLITLEPAISEDQTNQMEAMNLQLVVPKPLHQTYTTKQSAYIISLKQFLDEIRGLQ